MNIYIYIYAYNLEWENISMYKNSEKRKKIGAQF